MGLSLTKLKAVRADRLPGKRHTAVIFWTLDFGRKFHVSDGTKVATKVTY